MVIHRIINEVNLEINVEKINEKGNKVPEHWQDYEGLPSASAVRPDDQNVKVVGILMMMNDYKYNDPNKMRNNNNNLHRSIATAAILPPPPSFLCSDGGQVDYDKDDQ